MWRCPESRCEKREAVQKGDGDLRIGVADPRTRRLAGWLLATAVDDLAPRHLKMPIAKLLGDGVGSFRAIDRFSLPQIHVETPDDMAGRQRRYLSEGSMATIGHTDQNDRHKEVNPSNQPQLPAA